jgi:hypothetical protein
MYADRMLRGERVYRDFFQFTPPGTDLVDLVALVLLGPHIWVENTMVVALGVALGAACFRVARHIMADSLAAVAASTFTVLAYGQPLTATHHWFSLLAIMSAVAIVARRLSNTRLAVAGALLGLASFFTLSHGIAAFAAFCFFVACQTDEGPTRKPRVIVSYGALFVGFVLALLAASIYFVITVGAGQLWSILVSYVWHHIAGPLSLRLGLPEELTRHSLPALLPYLFVYALLPIAYGFVLWAYGRERSQLSLRGWPPQVTLLWLVGCALLIEVAMAPSWLRILAVAMPGIILFIWLSGRAKAFRRPLLQAISVGIACLGAILIRSTYRHHGVIVELPAGKTATDSVNRDKLQWLAQRIAPGDMFFESAGASIYLPLHLHNPLFLDVAVPTKQTRPKVVERAIGQLEALQLKYVLWSPPLEHAKAEDGLEGIVMLRAYLHEHYQPVRDFADGDQAWERK